MQMPDDATLAKLKDIQTSRLRRLAEWSACVAVLGGLALLGGASPATAALVGIVGAAVGWLATSAAMFVCALFALAAAGATGAKP